MARHFLSRLRQALYRCTKYRNTKLTATEKHDLRWFARLLELAHGGMSMNLLTLRDPNQLVVSDACPIGISGFSVNSGCAWRFFIPPCLRNKHHINFIEFLGNVMSILVEIYEGRSRPGDCFLSLGDNTTAMGWLMRSNFAEVLKAIHAGLARYLARGNRLAERFLSPRYRIQGTQVKFI